MRRCRCVNVTTDERDPAEQARGRVRTEMKETMGCGCGACFVSAITPGRRKSRVSSIGHWQLDSPVLPCPFPSTRRAKLLGCALIGQWLMTSDNHYLYSVIITLPYIILTIELLLGSLLRVSHRSLYNPRKTNMVESRVPATPRSQAIE